MPLHFDVHPTQSGWVRTTPPSRPTTVLHLPRYNDNFTATPNLSGFAHFNLLLNRIHDLLADEYDENIGEHPPASDNVERANHLLDAAFDEIKSQFPRGFASTTGEGDIRVYWRVPGRDIHLVLPPDTAVAPMLYMRDGATEQVDHDVSPHALAEALRRLAHA